jgi:hypothetical protein
MANCNRCGLHRPSVDRVTGQCPSCIRFAEGTAAPAARAGKRGALETNPQRTNYSPLFDRPPPSHAEGCETPEQRACRERRHAEFQARFSHVGRIPSIANPVFDVMHRPPDNTDLLQCRFDTRSEKKLPSQPLCLAEKKEAVLALAYDGKLSVRQLQAVMDRAASYGLTADEVHTLEGIHIALLNSIRRGYSLMVDNANTVDWWSRPRD